MSAQLKEMPEIRQMLVTDLDEVISTASDQSHSPTRLAIAAWQDCG